MEFVFHVFKDLKCVYKVVDTFKQNKYDKVKYDST